MFPILFSTFAFVVCLISLVLNVIQGNVGWTVVMAICMVVNAVMAVLNLVNYLS
jgi:hypothetical protein